MEDTRSGVMRIDDQLGLPALHTLTAGIELLRSEGIDVDDLRLALHRFSDVDRPGWWASELGMRTLWCGAQMIVERTGDARLGLRLGATLPFGAFGVLDYLAKAACTLRSLVHDVNTLAPLACEPFTWRLTEHGCYAELALVSRLSTAIHPLFVDFRLVHMHTRALTLLDDPSAAASAVHFSYPAPSLLAPYRQHFAGAELRFDAAAPALWFKRSYLDQPLPHGDAVLYAMLRAHAHTLGEGLPRAASVTERVRSYLAAEGPTGRLSVDDAAAALGMTERTLRRRLCDEGTSYQDVLDGVRTVLARAYLADPALSVDEVAARMGFENALAFRRAFRRWTGESLRAVCG
jgi:AraC-like DNA-binding protein